MASRTPKPERQRRLATELRLDPGLRLNQLAQRLNVSIETVRRDLNEMSQSGLLVRTYGGATVRTLAHEPPRAARETLMLPARRQIAVAASKLVEAGQVLMIDAGSTALEFARQLAVLESKVTVITNCPTVAETMGPTARRVVLCPGDYDHVEGGTFGPATMEFIGNYHADIAFIGASGLTADGLTDAHSPAAWVKRTMLQHCGRGVALLSQGKFGQRHLELVCPLDAVDAAVVEAAPSAEFVSLLQQADVQLVVALENPVHNHDLKPI